MKEIPFHRASIGAEEQAAVAEVLASGWLTTGAVAQRFEREFAEYVGSRFAVAVNSATAALHLALDAIGLQTGDEVLVPTYTFAATAEVVTYFGAVPVLCDSEPGGFNLDAADAEHRITPRTKAIIPVHIAGNPCNMDAIAALADRHSLHVIEDAAHALPASWRGKRIGGISEMTAFSFYATKTITTAEGGMLTTNDERIVKRASMMRLHGIAGDAWKRYSNEGSWYYEVMDAGYKCNLPDVLAAIGVAQLRKADAMHRRRSELAQKYLTRFANIEAVQLPPTSDGHAWHLFILRLHPDAQLTRNAVITGLKAAGIGTSVHFIPLHLQPYYRDRFGYRRGDFPAAEAAYQGAISLPIFPDLTDDEAERVMAAVEKVLWDQQRGISTAA